MSNQKSIRSEVMRLYNSIKKNFASASDAMRQAWMVVKAKVAMKQGETIITFFKKGEDVPTVRFGTLCSDLFSYTPKGSEVKQNPTQVKFFDLVSGHFKSFIATNLVQFKAVV